jgi:hypothetical protein
MVGEQSTLEGVEILLILLILLIPLILIVLAILLLPFQDALASRGPVVQGQEQGREGTQELHRQEEEGLNPQAQELLVLEVQ